MNYGDERTYAGWTYKLGQDPVPMRTRDGIVWLWAWKAVGHVGNDAWTGKHEKYGHFWSSETAPDQQRMDDAHRHCKAFIDAQAKRQFDPERLFAHMGDA